MENAQYTCTISIVPKGFKTRPSDGVGLISFAIAVWMLADRLPAWSALVIATAVWFVVSAAL